MLGIERANLIGKPFSSFVGDSKAFGEYLHNCFHTSETVMTAVEIKLQCGSFSAHLTGKSADSVEFHAKVAGLAITDISLYKLGEFSGD